MQNKRLASEFLLRLARRCVHIISPCLRDEELRDAFDEFYAASKEELCWYEYERARMLARLAAKRAPGRREVAESLESDPLNDALDGAVGPRTEATERGGSPADSNEMGK
jgi:hypothetical protein